MRLTIFIAIAFWGFCVEAMKIQTGIAMKRSDDTAGDHHRSHLLKSLRPATEFPKPLDECVGCECPRGWTGYPPFCMPGAGGIPTSETASFATTGEPGSVENTEAPPTMTSEDIHDLLAKCGNEGHDRRGGKINGVQRMINKFGAKQVVNAKDKIYQRTCLHAAADWGGLNIITLLLENGADLGLDPKDSNNETPLRLAIKWGRYNDRDYKCVTMLIQHGADLEKAKESNYKQSDFNKAMKFNKLKDAIAKGQSVQLGSDSDLVYTASSIWSSSYGAAKAKPISGSYWCSQRSQTAPQYWRIKFGDKPVTIRKIKFEEVYPKTSSGQKAEYDFFGTNTTGCPFNEEEVLIKGIGSQINDTYFANGKSYSCYGLKIKRLANAGGNGQLASLKKFQFFVPNLKKLKNGVMPGGWPGVTPGWPGNPGPDYEMTPIYDTYDIKESIRANDDAEAIKDDDDEGSMESLIQEEESIRAEDYASDDYGSEDSDSEPEDSDSEPVDSDSA